MVLICGDAKKVPWESSQWNIGRLFAMCKKAGTPVFVSGNGMSVMSYYCATVYNFMNVINGKENGG